MIHKIQTTELQPGMYVVNLFLAPREYPQVYPVEGLLLFAREITEIMRQGYREAFVDDARSTIPIRVKEAWAQLIETTKDDDPCDNVELPAPQMVKNSLEQAVSVYDKAVGVAEQMFHALRKGKELPVELACEAARSVVANVLRDSQTLATVARLHAHDDYTFNHSVNVSLIATLFGKALNMTEENLCCLATAGLLHDIGKVTIPQSLLGTARRLKETEMELMRWHVVAGYEKIKNIPGLSKKLKLAILEHHERYNGSGYPYGRSGDQISLMGRVLSIVDVYDALTGKRAYKSPLIPYTAVSFLFAQRGQNFDPELIDHFIQCVGVYPVGSVVTLNTGETGVVYIANAHKPLLPVVAVVLAADGSRQPITMIDLATETSTGISHCADPACSGINCASILRSCTWAMRSSATKPGTEQKREGLSFAMRSSALR